MSSVALNVLLSLVLVSVLRSAPTNTDVAQPEVTTDVPRLADGSYPLIRIVDGDTLIVGTGEETASVRLIGIDAPEPNDPGGPECYAVEATAHLQQILGQTGTLILTFDPTQDQIDTYGRLLAYVALPNGTDVGETMLRDGYAVEYTYKKPYTSQGRYVAAEAEAMQAQRGLWAPEACKRQ